MRGIGAAFRGAVVTGLLFVGGTAAEVSTPSRERARPASDEAIQYQGQEPQGAVLYFPDYVEGGGWSVQLVLSNTGAVAATAVVEVYGRDGESVSDLFDSGSTLEIPGLGSRVLRSSGAGDVRRGWIQVRPDTDSVSGLLTYRHRQTGIEVGVQPIDLGSQFALSIEETSEIGMGLAIFKPDVSPKIEFRIRDDQGNDPIGEIVRWGDFQQWARTLPEWFENVDTSFLRDIRGLLFLRTADNSDFAPLGLRFGKQKGSLSAVPAIRTQGAETQEASLVFPDYVDGGGWLVQLVISNVDPDAAAEAIVEIYDEKGRPIRDLFDSELTLEIPSLGSRILRSGAGGAIRRGWIEVRTDAAAVSGLLTYRHVETGIEVGVQPIQPGSQFALFVEETSEIGTGLAIFKPPIFGPGAPTFADIEFQIRDEEGNDPIGEVLIPGDFHQRALTLPEWFEIVDTRFLTDFRGLLFLRSTDGSDFAPLGLRFGKQKGSLSAVPVIPIRDAGGGKMYWTDLDRAKIQRANLDGSSVEDIVTSGLRFPTGLALDLPADKVYWTDFGAAKIQRANLDGSGVEDLVTSGLRNPTGLALDLPAGKVYWTDLFKIQRANLDGSGVEDLVTRTSGVTNLFGLTLDLPAGKMYWTRAAKIQRANLDGSGVEDLVTSGLTSPKGLALDRGAGKMYWTDSGTAKIQRANLDGSGVEDLVTSGLSAPYGLALDPGAGKMYWTDARTDRIQRANLDGSEVEDLVTSGLGSPRGLALDLGGSVGGSPGPVPPTVRLSISPTSIERGHSATLTWSSTNAVSATIIPGIGAVPTSGSRSVSPTVTTTYRITVRNATGQTASATATVTVSVPPDLVVETLSVSVSTATTGQAFDLRATVRNQGGRRSPATTLRYYRSNNRTISTDDTLVGTDAVSALSASAASAESIRLTAPSSAGTYYYGACVDPVSGESRTANNCSQGLRVTVSEGSSGAGKMYWTEFERDRIRRANLDGSGVEGLVTSGLDAPLALALGGGKMYWTEAVAEKIQRANLDGSGVEDLAISGLGLPSGLALDLGGGKMYWTDWWTNKIQRANLDGSGVEDLVTIGLRGPRGIALDLDAGKMYWTDDGRGRIRRANLDGSGVENLVTSGLSEPKALVLDLGAGKMYWTDFEQDKIQRANLDGSGVEDLVTSGVTGPYGIALDLNTGKIYWTSWGTAKIQRANLDGSGVEDLASGVSFPTGLALDLAGN